MTTHQTSETERTAATMTLDELLALTGNDLFNRINEVAKAMPEHEKTLKALYFAIDEFQSTSADLIKDFRDAKRHAEEGEQHATAGFRCDANWLLSDAQRITSNATKRQHAADTAKVLFRLLPEGIFSK